jgi:hypothetical protein
MAVYSKPKVIFMLHTFFYGTNPVALFDSVEFGIINSIILLVGVARHALRVGKTG